MRKELHHAGFLDRFLAEFCDFVIVIVFASVVYSVVDRAMVRLPSNVRAENETLAMADVAASFWFLVIWFLWNLTYLVGKTGRSWGRRIGGTKVVGIDGCANWFLARRR